MKKFSPLFRSACTAAVMLGGVLAATSAHAQFAPRVASEEIEGAIMPAIPFPLNDSVANQREMPASLGLAPIPTVDAEKAPAPEPMVPRITRGSFSAQSVADRLLNR